MISMIGALIEKGYAYQAENGDVFYKVRSFNDYGKLSGKSLDDLRAGERVEVDTFKEDPLDFVLWKSVKPNEPHWPSPWGHGRPGWHIECSVMSAQHLGAHFDIHGGGQDLQFPHHENEIAQSEAAHNCQMANYWMHNGFVRVDDEKMSKSLGNFFTIREVLKKYDAEVVRFFILRAHYRSPLNYSDQHLDDAKSSLTRLYTALRGMEVSGADYVDWSHSQAARFKEAMDDDFNTSEAMAVLFDLANEVNKTKSIEVARLLKNLGAVVGLLQRDANAFLQGDVMPPQFEWNSDEEVPDESWYWSGNNDTTPNRSSAHSPDSIDTLILERLEAKKAKNFAEADRIRKELADNGVILEDTPQGTTWRRS
jgi:cysteinyl-tRNA synthetase